jgi:hypothetical protein
MKINIRLLFCFLIVSFNSLTLAQEDKKPFIVSSFIGDTLSLSERNYYQLFPQIDGFQWAVFYLNPDSSLNANVKYLSGEEFRDTLIINYKSLKTLTYHINARNALENESRDGFYPVYKPSNEKGSEVCAYMNDGKETSGELLSVRKRSILILKPDCDENLNNLDCVIHRKASEIDKLIIKGNSNVGWGIGLGLLASLVAAAFIYSSNYDSNSWLASVAAYNKSKTPVILSSIGLITLGTTVGILTSTPDKTIEPFSENDIVGLSSYSRFPEREPDRLKKVE